MRRPFFVALFLLSLASTVCAEELPDIRTEPADFVMPEVKDAAPSAGMRVRQTSAGWEKTQVYHILYLPQNWRPDGHWPVLVEYAGNGGFQNAYGDRSEGTVEGGRLAYGLSAGRGYICIGMPYLEPYEGDWRNAVKWWGDADECAKYAVATVRDVCTRYGGDPAHVVVCGFSRGAIGCNYLGLWNDEIAALWCGFLCHSHYDGVEKWSYPASDRDSARKRLDRLHGRPQFISQENGGVAKTRDYLLEVGVEGKFKLVDFPYRNHTDDWALRDCPFRRQARAWLETVAPAGE